MPIRLGSEIQFMKCKTLAIDSEILGTILESGRRLFPKEKILLLRGKRTKDTINVTELVVPPLATYGDGFASLPLYMLPVDFSIVGTVHSHPSGGKNPSVEDCNHMFGLALMIVSFPFAGEKDVAVYDYRGEPLSLQVVRE